MDSIWQERIGGQLGAAIDTLENAMRACPDELWGDRHQRPEFWYAVYHTLFFLDLYLSDAAEEFVPPAPFTLSEMDPAGVLPDRVYTRDELHAYLEHCRRKCRRVIDAMTAAKAGERRTHPWGTLDFAELLLYTMRHVQHHAGQLNLILRQKVDAASRWVVRARTTSDVPR